MKKNGGKNSPAKKIAVTGILSAAALALSFLESLIPSVSFLPPGAKLGLSNIAVMFSVLTASFPQTLAVIVIKSMFSLFTKGGVAFALSFTGGILSCAVMYIFTRRFNKTGFVGVSVLSAVAHNMGQLLAASVLTGQFIAAYIPPLIVFGIIFGTVTGIVLKAVMPSLRRIFPE